MLGFKTIEEFTLTECDVFIQRADIGESERQRAICRKNQLIACKKPEQHIDMPQTVIERIPNIKFVLNPNQSFIPLWFWITLPIQAYLLCIPLIVSGILIHKRRKIVKNCFIEETKYRLKLISDLYKIGIYNKNTMTIVLPIDYDNIIRIDTDCFLVEKNEKFGAFKKNRIVVPVKYDKLQWNGNNNVFYGISKDKHIVIDINGNELN